MTPGMILKPGESSRVSISAREKWADTGIDVEAGEAYRFRAEGKWKDLFTECGADGYTSGSPWMVWAEKKRRMPEARWFELIGTIGKEEASYFRIGAGCEYKADRTGRLYCFANDLTSMYWNNCGRVWINIEKLT